MKGVAGLQSYALVRIVSAEGSALRRPEILPAGRRCALASTTDHRVLKACIRYCAMTARRPDRAARPGRIAAPERGLASAFYIAPLTCRCN
jgi:hypothetical protein